MMDGPPPAYNHNLRQGGQPTAGGYPAMPVAGGYPAPAGVYPGMGGGGAPPPQQQPGHQVPVVVGAVAQPNVYPGYQASVFPAGAGAGGGAGAAVAAGGNGGGAAAAAYPGAYGGVTAYPAVYGAAAAGGGGGGGAVAAYPTYAAGAGAAGATAPGEVKLFSSVAERRRFEDLANFYSIIKALDVLECAFTKDAVTSEDYTTECSKLLAQYVTQRDALQSAGAIKDTDNFMMRFKQLHCPHALNRINIGKPATLAVKGGSQPANGHGLAAFEAASQVRVDRFDGRCVLVPACLRACRSRAIQVNTLRMKCSASF